MEKENHFDVLIIGAGISGIDAAYHIQKHCDWVRNKGQLYFQFQIRITILTHVCTAHFCKTLFLPKYCSSDNIQDPILTLTKSNLTQPNPTLIKIL